MLIHLARAHKVKHSLASTPKKEKVVVAWDRLIDDHGGSCGDSGLTVGGVLVFLFRNETKYSPVFIETSICVYKSSII